MKPIAESVANHDLEIFPPLVAHAARYNRVDLVSTFYSSYIKGLMSEKTLEPEVYEDMLYMTGDLIFFQECLSSGKQALAYLKKHTPGKEEHNKVLQKIEDVIYLREIEERDDLFPPVIQVTLLLIVGNNVGNQKLAQFYWEYQLVKYVDAARESLERLRDKFPRFFDLNKTFYLMLMNRKKYKGLKTRYEKQWMNKSHLFPEHFEESYEQDDTDFDRTPFKEMLEGYQSRSGATDRSEEKVLEDFVKLIESNRDMDDSSIDTFLELLDAGYDEADFDDMDMDEMFEKLVEVEKPYVRPQRKVGRNEPCPCGSKKKYKQCCGRSGARVV
jgi:hypothetical protein